MKPKRITITPSGEVKRDLNVEATQLPMRNTLLERLFPDIRICSVQVPTDPIRDRHAKTRIEGALNCLEVDGVPYRLIGGSGSSKNGKFYAVSQDHWKAVAARFRKWPEALLSYLGILLSECRFGIVEATTKVMVVKDHDFGTNDCRGWISPQLFRQFKKLGPGRFYQFRLAFGSYQAKGSFKIMPADVAEVLGVDLLIPESSVKPGGISVPFTFDGRVVVGIRDVSKCRPFNGSYSLVMHAPHDSMREEIVPPAKEQVQKVSESLGKGDYADLLRLIGADEALKAFSGEETPEDLTYTSVEATVVSAVLKADGSGKMVLFPHIHAKLQRLLARWARRMLLGGGLKLPGFALADDGVLFRHGARVYSASDWLPEETVISNSEAGRCLVVRYPIRMPEDLLPVRKLSEEDYLRHLAKGLGCPDSVDLKQVFQKQVSLAGCLVLNSQTAAQNGGDFDFDLVCAVEETSFKCWVDHAFAQPRREIITKTKHKKKQSLEWELPQVALSCVGNPIGRITDVITSCHAGNRKDLADKLGVELQNALDALKHDTRPDLTKIEAIEAIVPRAPWLQVKKVTRIEDLPEPFDVDFDDVVGRLYNGLWKKLSKVLDPPLEAKAFRGLLVQEPPPLDMLRECQAMKVFYGGQVGEIVTEANAVKEQLQAAREKWVEAKKLGDKTLKDEAWKTFSDARSAMALYEKVTAPDRWGSLFTFVRSWAEGKREHRLLWAQAMAGVVCPDPPKEDEERPKARGSLLFQTFPQEVVDLVCRRTGGRPVVLPMPELPEGLDFRVVENKENLSYEFYQGDRFIFETTVEGHVIMGDEVIRRVHPFQAKGPARARDGKVFLSNPQRPKVT